MRCCVRVKNTVTLPCLCSPPTSEPLSGLTSGWSCKSDTTPCFLRRVTLTASEVTDVSSQFQHLESVSKKEKKNTVDVFIFQCSKSVYWNIQTPFIVWGCINPRQISRIPKIMLYTDWLRAGKKIRGIYLLLTHFYNLTSCSTTNWNFMWSNFWHRDAPIHVFSITILWFSLSISRYFPRYPIFKVDYAQKM